MKATEQFFPLMLVFLESYKTSQNLRQNHAKHHILTRRREAIETQNPFDLIRRYE